MQLTNETKRTFKKVTGRNVFKLTYISKNYLRELHKTWNTCGSHRKEHGHSGVSFSVVLTIAIDIEILKNYILKTELHETKSILKVIGRNALKTDLHFERESSPKKQVVLRWKSRPKRDKRRWPFVSIYSGSWDISNQSSTRKTPWQ